MEFLTSLWLPILVSAAAVWVYSAISWMMLPHHRKDHVGLPDEDRFLAMLRELNLPPATYSFPHCGDHRQAKDPAFMEKWKTGPAGMLNVWRPNVSMGANMIKTFAVLLLISAMAAYLGWAAMGPGAPFGKVMQLLATAGVLAFTTASLPTAIWFQTSRNAVISCIIDGVVQGLILGAVFAWLWPKLAAAPVVTPMG